MSSSILAIRAGRMTISFALLWLTSLCFVHDTEGKSGKAEVSDAQLAANIDQFVTRLFPCNRAPTAMTLAVIRNGRTILTKGYGRTKVKKGQPVNSRTRFAIGSLTKAFTATLVVNWLRQNNKTLDTPIQSFYPEFFVTDDLRSRMATFRDLLAHRMGIPGHIKPLLAGFPKGLTRAEFVRTMAYMPTWLSFRNKMRYNNYMYTVAAHVIEKMSNGQTWEDLVRDLLLVPLNMTETEFFMEPNSSYNNNATDSERHAGYHIPNFASSCAHIDGRLQDVSPELWLSINPCGPAGAIYSNAEDMAKWMTFLLSQGRESIEYTIVDPEVIRTTWTPSILSSVRDRNLWRPASPVSHVLYGYGQGWISADYRGFRQLLHTGGFITHSSMLWLFPGLEAGIYLTVNGPQFNKRKLNFMKSVMYYATDEILGESQWFNSSSVCKRHPASRRKSVDVSPRKRIMNLNYGNSTSETLSHRNSFNYSLKAPGNQSSFVCSNCPHIRSFVGTYSHKCFGNMQISLDSSASHLVYTFGRFGQATFSRISQLEFEGNFDGLLKVFNSPDRKSETLLFTQDDKDDIDGVQYLSDYKGKRITFKRLANEAEHPKLVAIKTRSAENNFAKDGCPCHPRYRFVTALAACLAPFVIVFSLA